MGFNDGLKGKWKINENFEGIWNGKRWTNQWRIKRINVKSILFNFILCRLLWKDGKTNGKRKNRINGEVYNGWRVTNNDVIKSNQSDIRLPEKDTRTKKIIIK